jgi:hypothetical protein
LPLTFSVIPVARSDVPKVLSVWSLLFGVQLVVYSDAPVPLSVPIAVLFGPVTPFFALTVVLSGSSKTYSNPSFTFSLPPKTLSVADKTFSAADKTFSDSKAGTLTPEKTFFVGSETFSTAEKTFSTAQKVFIGTEKTFSTPLKTFFAADQTPSVTKKAFSKALKGTSTEEKVTDGRSESPATTVAGINSYLRNIPFTGYPDGAQIVGNEIVPIAIPEPASGILLLGAAGLAMGRRRREVSSLKHEGLPGRAVPG